MDFSSATSALNSLSRREAPSNDLENAAIVLKSLKEANESSKYDQNSEISLNEDSLSALRALLLANKWETRAACYYAISELLKINSQLPNDFYSFLFDRLEIDLEDIEPRTRTAASKLLYDLGRVKGIETWTRLGSKILDLVKTNLVKNEEERLAVMKEFYSFEVKESEVNEVKIAHETMGWKALETALKGIDYFITGMSEAFIQQNLLSVEIIDLVQRTFSHENRYVREIGYNVSIAILKILCDSDHPRKEEFLQILVIGIAKGLKDNWSQVRYASSVAVRELLTRVMNDEYLELLIPKMCLNRYYLAMGVKLYSQETWKLLFANKGIDLVVKYLPLIVEFYISQSEADNHAVREAACYCIAELATKVSQVKDESDKGVLNEYVPSLLKALLTCFKDESWPVRDAACVASAQFVSGFPEESKETVKTELLDLWLKHLSDNIWSVREDSAIALGIVFKAYSNKKENAKSKKSSLSLKLDQPKSETDTPVLGAFLKNYQPKAKKEIVNDQNTVEMKSEKEYSPIHEVLEKLDSMLEEVYKQKKDEFAGKVNYIEFDLNDSRSVVSTSTLDADSDELRKYHKRKSKPKGVVTGYISELSELEKHEAEVRAELAKGKCVDTADDPVLRFTNQQLFSCGSLAPKLKRGVGCMDHGFSRPRKAWEVTDGAVYLVRELCVFDADLGLPYVKKLGEIAKNCRHFTDHEKLIENIWKSIIAIAHAVGKRKFKTCLEDFLATLIEDLNSDNKLLAATAMNAVLSLRDYLGEEIFYFRVANAFMGDKLLSILDKHIARAVKH